MLLTPQWKKAIIPRVTEQLFTWFTLHEFNSVLSTIIIRYRNQHKEPFNCIEHDGVFHGLNRFSGNKVFPCRISKHDPNYISFISLIEKQKLYQKLTKEVVNWLSCGLAMCRTTDCICEVFPEFILGKFEYAVGQHNIKFNKVYTSNPKFLAFIQRNEIIEREVKTNLVIQTLSPGEMYGKDSV